MNKDAGYLLVQREVAPGTVARRTAVDAGGVARHARLGRVLAMLSPLVLLAEVALAVILPAGYLAGWNLRRWMLFGVVLGVGLRSRKRSR